MRPLSTRALAAIAAAAAAATFGGSLLRVWDPDAFHHLAMGRHLARHGLAGGEPFLFPLLGAPGGPPPHWLGSLAIYGAYRLAGEAALQLLPATVGAVLAIVLLLDAAPRDGRHTPLTLAAAAPALVLALLGFRYRAVARPELFATLLVPLVLWAVRRFEDGRPRLLLAFPVLALLWTNLHPSVVAGLAIVAILAGSAVLRLLSAARGGAGPPDPGLRRDALVASAVAATGALAALVSPSPDAPLRAALRFAVAHYLPHGSGAASAEMAQYDRTVLSRIREMGPLEAHFWIEPFGLLLLLTAAALALAWAVAGRRPRLREVVTVAAFAALAWGGARFALLLAVVCAPIAARSLGEVLAALPAAGRPSSARRVGAAVCVLAAAVALPTAGNDPTLCLGAGPRPGAYPVRAADYLETLGFRGRLFNTFHLGGYLEWRELGPPYQDGRGIWLPGEARAALAGTFDRHAFGGLDAAYRFDALLLAYPDERPTTQARLAARFGGEDWAADRSTWSLVAFDDGGLLYLRRDGAYAERAARDEFRVARPATATFAPRPDQLPALLEEFRRAVREAPACSLCRYYHGVAAYSLGLLDEARAAAAALPAPGCPAHALPLDDLREALSRAGGR